MACPRLKLIGLLLFLCVFSLFMQSKQKEADVVKKEFAGDSRSDHIALLRAYEVVCTA